MYSNEIDNFFKSVNFELNTYEDLENILRVSPQINHVKLEMFGSTCSKYWIGTNDNHNWTIYIKNG